MATNSLDLPRLFAAVTAALILKQEELNSADPYNRDHGDHMVEIFQVATEAAAIKGSRDLPGAMEYAAELLRARPDNGSAQVYARGLEGLADQFRQRGLGLEDLAPYVKRALHKEKSGVEAPERNPGKSAEVLRALLNALASWEKAEVDPQAEPPPQADAGGTPAPSRGALDMGYLFGVGMSYMQAKQKGGDPLEILVETVVSSSPLARLPHRAQGGKIALRALLEALGGRAL